MLKLEETRQILKDHPDMPVKTGLFDLDGILRGKYLSASKFQSALESGYSFCSVVLGWDSNDELYDNTSFAGWHTGYPDAPARIVPESGRRLPFEDGQLFFLSEFAGEAEAVCPRALLRRVIARAKKMGYTAFSGLEYEFFVFQETPETVRAKDYQNLVPLAPGNFGYSVLRTSEHAELYKALISGCAGAGIPIEGLHEETGAGVLEAAIAYDDVLNAADMAALFKQFAKIICRQHGAIATFMAKCHQDWPGQSGHMHISLRDKDDKSVFYDSTADNGISQKMRHFIGGQQRLMPQILAMLAPTVNSYSRLVPGYWAPTDATWGIDNRTCALRVITGSAKSQRLEYRVGGADANPYLALAAALASGLWGIENQIEPEEAITGNAYEYDVNPDLRLPATLWDAAQNLKASKVARDWFGDTFVDHFAATREWEERAFRQHVTDWERRRYFEII